jgi:hypothetical protein
MPRKDRSRLISRRKRTLTPDPHEPVPGPTDNPATNLLLADIVMRMGSYVMRDGVERAFLTGRYGKGTAKRIVSSRSITRSIVSVAIAKLGTRSIPGAAIVGAGVLAKTLYDRSQSRRRAQIEGDVELIERASKPSARPDT